jgi:hypothetical protein
MKMMNPGAVMWTSGNRRLEKAGNTRVLATHRARDNDATTVDGQPFPRQFGGLDPVRSAGGLAETSHASATAGPGDCSGPPQHRCAHPCIGGRCTQKYAADRASNPDAGPGRARGKLSHRCWSKLRKNKSCGERAPLYWPRKMVPISARHAHVPAIHHATTTCCSTACHREKGPGRALRALVWSKLG